jgi:hypothetical protein
VLRRKNPRHTPRRRTAKFARRDGGIIEGATELT